MTYLRSQSNLVSSPSSMDQLGPGDPQVQVAMVFVFARLIEPDRKRVMEWYFHDPIASLGGFTADQLVKAGRACEIVDFLGSIDF